MTAACIDWAAVRRRLHQHPEISDNEAATSRFITELINRLNPDETLPNLGGHGVAFVFDSKEQGPTTLVRCELDALPIHETRESAYRSTVPGVSHQCGHDGHMTIVAALAADLAARRPQTGRVVLLYQPAEETGVGAERIIHDPTFARIRPDYAFALHNVPGLALGEVAAKAGPINCASRGLVATLRGHTSHAAHPENGLSPALAMSRTIAALDALPARIGGRNWITIVHARLGEKSFGIAPGDAAIMATLRSETDAGMEQLVAAAERLIIAEAAKDSLSWSLGWEDIFTASSNSEGAFNLIKRACEHVGIPFTTLAEPYRWSEDFGKLSAAATHGALFALGAGVHSPQLHNSHYDFPDSLIPVGAAIFRRIIDQINDPTIASNASRCYT